jgi:hypothetical protein
MPRFKMSPRYYFKSTEGWFLVVLYSFNTQSDTLRTHAPHMQRLRPANSTYPQEVVMKTIRI